MLRREEGNTQKEGNTHKPQITITPVIQSNPGNAAPNIDGYYDSPYTTVAAWEASKNAASQQNLATSATQTQSDTEKSIKSTVKKN